MQYNFLPKPDFLHFTSCAPDPHSFRDVIKGGGIRVISMLFFMNINAEPQRNEVVSLGVEWRPELGALGFHNTWCSPLYGISVFCQVQPAPEDHEL